jgi:hypothetical protein
MSGKTGEIDRYLLADIFPCTRPRKAPKRLPENRTLYGLKRMCEGSYSTPDGIGHAERAGREWHAWRDDIPGVTAHFDRLRDAAYYALHGDG